MTLIGPPWCTQAKLGDSKVCSNMKLGAGLAMGLGVVVVEETSAAIGQAFSAAHQLESLSSRLHGEVREFRV